jgi:glycosyltransferase involved in cell wall biosynthesis
MRTSRPPRRILVARSVDASNINAQSKNAKEILARWTNEEWRPTAFAFHEPDARVAANPNVDILRVPSNRLWYARVGLAYQGSFHAIFYPGLHRNADYVALRIRALVGSVVPLISTMENLPGSTADDASEAFYSAVAGHEVYCQKLDPSLFAHASWINRAADHIVAISPFLARMAAKKFGPKVSELPLGIEAFRGLPVERKENARPVVVTAGNVRAHKRPELFLDLARSFPEADFRWFGEGELRAGLNEEAARRGLGNVSFSGQIASDRLAAEFQSADIFVLPSKSEGVPKVSQEAAAAGLPQVIFGYFEAPSVIDGQNGYVVWDDAAFAGQLRDLLADPALRRRMGDLAAKMADEWSWDRLAPKWQQRILDIIGSAKSLDSRVRSSEMASQS